MRALILGGTFIVLILFGLVAFAADTKTDYDRSVNFRQYRTFAWKDSGGSSTADNSLVAERIQRTVKAKLSAKGWREDTRNPDVYLTSHVDAEYREDINYLPGYGGWYYWGWMGSQVYINRYVEGQVILDMVDTKTNRLVWRSISSETGSSVIDVQKQKEIDDIVDESFKHFPPGMDDDS